MRAVSLGPTLPRTLRGAQNAIAVENLNNFTVRDAAAAKMLQAMYAGTSDQVLNGTGRETFEAVALLQSIQKTPYQPAAGADYPQGPLRRQHAADRPAHQSRRGRGSRVRRYRRLGSSRERNRPEASVGQLANVLREFGNSLAAFYQDLGDRMEDVVVVTMSEFGRTAKENGNRGTDHGHANAMFVMGGPVQAARSTASGPALRPSSSTKSAIWP